MNTCNKKRPQRQPGAQNISANTKTLEQAAALVNFIIPNRHGQLEYQFIRIDDGLLVRWRRVGTREPWTFVTSGPGLNGRLVPFATEADAVNAASQHAGKAGVL